MKELKLKNKVSYSEQTVILLTASVNVRNVINTKLQDSEIRKAHYIEAILYYLNNTQFNIVFCENTNTNFYDEIDIKDKNKRLEYLYFNGNSQSIFKGKAYGEMMIIKYALENSIFLRNSKYIIKITGRIIVSNINNIVSNLKTNLNRNLFVNFIFINYANSVCFIA